MAFIPTKSISSAKITHEEFAEVIANPLLHVESPCLSVISTICMVPREDITQDIALCDTFGL